MSVPVDVDVLNDPNATLDELLAFLNGSPSDAYDAWKGDWTVLAEPRWQTAIIVAYTIVIVFGFFANLLIVVVIARFKQLHTVTNIFIAYLAIADVALCVFNLPIQLHYQLNNKWVFGRILCYVAMPTFGVPFFSSSLAILMIAVDRYMLIVFPFKRRMSNSHAILTVALIVLFTIALSTPLIVSIQYVEIAHPMFKSVKTSCAEVYWPSYTHKQVYSVSIFLLQFVMPICLTSFFYTRICSVLHRRPVKKKDTRRNLRTNRILIAVVLTFTMCWLPWSVFALTSEFDNKLIPVRYFTMVDLLLKLFAMGSACINPFLYGWLNDNFKKELGKLFGYKLCCAGSGRPGWRGGVSYSRTTDINNGTVLLRSEMCVKDKPSGGDNIQVDYTPVMGHAADDLGLPHTVDVDRQGFSL
ncbi:neuropeptide Y receptor type 1 [Elysia marginata]|uniref:Neuropeptide Y receptor type 1 n=1 Tax=Elysia marginata TaxID=1093978 RepID=A0AAV4HP50_9GAST|nr:neuropeptide Y receptor type 1 [Elysia marginata]